MMQMPRTPRSGAPPYCFALVLRFSAFSAPAISSAPTMRSGLRVISCLSQLLTAWAMLSLVLRMTFPVNPSHTTTSTSPLKTSWPSMLPMKLMGAVSSASNVSLLSALPLASSVPTLMRPTCGGLRPRTFRE